MRIALSSARPDDGDALRCRILPTWGLVLLTLALPSKAAVEEMEWVRVSGDGKTFVLDKSGVSFVPWGFNYDHDDKGRLIEDYWHSERKKVEEDFQEMKQLGANVVRIHLQLGRFMRSQTETDPSSLDQFGHLLELAERLRVYLDITGLGCYHKQDVPAWYDALSEKDRWEVQARFWEAVAERCARSPAVFCYDLMNEPVVPGGSRKRGDWLGPPFAGKCFVQFVSLEQADRPRPEIARLWCQQLAKAIRKHDGRHLITVGLVSWSLNRPGLTSGFEPDRIVSEIDFVSVHLYPEKSEVDASLKTLHGFSVGKPVVIEEMFPLRCPMDEFKRFVDESRVVASGWIGFYWGRTLQEYRRSEKIADAIMAEWLEFFAEGAEQFAAQK
jgi:hypothetical protein